MADSRGQGVPARAAPAGRGAGDDGHSQPGSPVTDLRSQPGRHHRVDAGVRAGRRRRAGAEGACAPASQALGGASGQTGSGGGAAPGAPGVRHAPHSRRAGALRSAGCERDTGAGDPARGGAAGGTRADAGARARPPSLRARGAQPAVAVGHLHVSAATPRAAVPDSLHGRPLALHRVVGDGAQSAVDAGDGGAGARHRGLRHAAGDPD